MRPMLLAAAAAAILALGAAPALAQDAGPAKVGQTSLGPTLTDAQGMTLYTFNRDMTGYSNCNAQCAVDWPPLAAAPDAKASGDWSTIPRDDGKRQWAYKGKAVYTFSKDAKPGDTAGEGAAGGKWHAAKP